MMHTSDWCNEYTGFQLLHSTETGHMYSLQLHDTPNTPQNHPPIHLQSLITDQPHQSHLENPTHPSAKPSAPQTLSAGEMPQVLLPVQFYVAPIFLGVVQFYVAPPAHKKAGGRGTRRQRSPPQGQLSPTCILWFTQTVCAAQPSGKMALIVHWLFLPGLSSLKVGPGADRVCCTQMRPALGNILASKLQYAPCPKALFSTMMPTFFRPMSAASRPAIEPPCLQAHSVMNVWLRALP